MSTKPLADLVQELSPSMQTEVRDFVEFQLAKRKRKKGRKLRQDLAGALQAHRGQYTSLGLQKVALKWRLD